MAYWWVNHKQTHKSELSGGYIWSPQKNNDGSTNQTYLNLKKAQECDVMFSYANGLIKAVGIVTAQAVLCPKPEAFGNIGEQWSKEGWLVEVRWKLLKNGFNHKNHINTIVPLLPVKHSPIQLNGNGNQSVYLAAISDKLGEIIIALISQSEDGVSSAIIDFKAEISEQNELENIQKKHLSPTQKTTLIQARVGQGLFRSAVEQIEPYCRLTKMREKELLIASHIKPWRNSSDEEKLDGNNGLLLSPHVDKLFDKGLITFSDDGNIQLAHPSVGTYMESWGLDHKINIGAFSINQKKYLLYHREVIFAERKEAISKKADLASKTKRVEKQSTVNSF